MDRAVQQIVDIVETWELRRIPLARSFTKNGMTEFVETQNALTRQLIAGLDRKDPEFWSALLELAQNGARMTAGGKLFADGKDMTDK